MKRTGWLMSLALLLVLTMPRPSPAKIIVGLSSVNVAFLPIYGTEAENFFNDDGLDVLLVLFNEGPTNLQVLIGGA